MTESMSRRSVLRTVAGLSAVAVAGATSVLLASPALATPALQSNWRYCVVCTEIFYAGAVFHGKCPGQPMDGHNVGASNYSALENWNGDPNFYQAGWRRCALCQALVWPQYNNGGSHCVANNGGLGDHVLDTSVNYSVPFGVDDPSDQNGWDACAACACYYFGNGWGQDRGYCWKLSQYAGTQVPHEHASSTHYQFQFT